MKMYNLQHVNEIANGDQEFINEIIKAFIVELPPDVSLLKDAVENNNPKLAYSVAHKMKPNLQIFGIDLMRNIKRLEMWSNEELERNEILDDTKQIDEKISLACKALQEDFKNI